jgi:hypothetical protein
MALSTNDFDADVTIFAFRVRNWNSGRTSVREEGALKTHMSDIRLRV